MNKALIAALIDEFIGNYAVTAFHNMNLNRILHLLLDLAASGSGGGGGLAFALPVTSADFINATDCPIVSVAGQNLFIIWAEGSKIMVQGIDFTLLVGGGFSVTIPGFDSTTDTFHFFVFTTP